VPKILVAGRAPVRPTPANIIAVIGRDGAEELDATRFRLDEIEALTDLVEKEAMATHSEPRVDLFVNDDQIPLRRFPRDTLRNILAAFVATLDGVAREWTSLRVVIEKRPTARRSRRVGLNSGSRGQRQKG
jgi:hypothetical protein